MTSLKQQQNDIQNHILELKQLRADLSVKIEEAERLLFLDLYMSFFRRNNIKVVTIDSAKRGLLIPENQFIYNCYSFIDLVTGEFILQNQKGYFDILQLHRGLAVNGMDTTIRIDYNSGILYYTPIDHRWNKFASL